MRILHILLGILAVGVALALVITTRGTGAGAPEGTLAGTITIGPLCPVEREGEPCLPTQDTFIARPVVVRDAKGKTVARIFAEAPAGTFSIPLTPGSYDVTVESESALERVEAQRVTISANTVTTVAFDIDTGIR